MTFGKGKFHPIDEFYDYAAYKFMGLMRLADDLISEVMFNVYRDRASRRLAIHSERDGLAYDRDTLLFSLDNLTAERDFILARETENARIVSEGHSHELTAHSEARDTALSESAANALALGNLQKSCEQLSCQHDELCAQQNCLFNDLRLEGGNGCARCAPAGQSMAANNPAYWENQAVLSAIDGARQ